MKNYKFQAVGSLILLFIISLVVFADTRNYSPPPEKGFIYIVVRYRQGIVPQPTRITVKWGRYNREDEIRPPAKLLFPGSGIPEGFVIRLRHTNNDSISLTVETNGSIQQLYQGNEPREWKRGEYKQLTW